MKKWVLIVALVIATPVAARDLGVPADKGWKHAETGLILMPQLAGLSRTTLTDATETEHDVAAQYDVADKSVFATIYLFHPAIPDVALWFDRSQTALETRDIFRHAAPASADPIAFAATNSGTATSLRQVYASPGGAYRSTALAVVPVGEWIVSIRMSEKTLTADQLDASLQQVIKAVRWPPSATTATIAAAPVTPCTTPLTFTKAKQAKPNGADLLMSLMASTMAAKAKTEEKSAPPVAHPSWCRDGSASTEYGVYRSNASTGGYVMALYDAGRVVSIYPSLMGQVDKSGTYAVSLEDVEGTTSVFPSFTALPSPKQVWDLVGSGKRSGTMKGKQMTLDPKAL
ncbi:hypothetical protein [Sphingomonas faeni]|uniref:hypothetical protein n=1 Tax=Sphingomonas TaxID=13687 RepID=UPI003EC134CF